jgi:hypothetical protein
MATNMGSSRQICSSIWEVSASRKWRRRVPEWSKTSRHRVSTTLVIDPVGTIKAFTKQHTSEAVHIQVGRRRSRIYDLSSGFKHVPEYYNQYNRQVRLASPKQKVDDDSSH